jgi:Domain of unknown function (DUF4307)
MTAPAPDLAERYGAPSRVRRPLVIAVIAVLVAAAAAWLVWVTVYQDRPEVTSQLVGYQIHGQHDATATFTVVRRDAHVDASCLLRASASDHAVVGQLTVPVTSGPLTAQVRSTMRTEREATTVDLVGCTTRDQPRQQ